MSRIVRHLISKLFQPQNIVPKNVEVKYDELTSRSQKLMLDLGIIRQANNGLFYILPLGERSLKKLVDIVNDEMEKIDAQKLSLPSLSDASLWKTSGRLDAAGDELFTLKDRHNKSFVLNPTHEEAITELLASVSQVSYRQLPLRLYQITSKFRDEMKPRFGLLRSKEFLMKDLYTFDMSLDKARESYEIVTSAYNKVFRRIGVKYVRVAGLTGMIGGSMSHEFHFPSAVGEDRLVICESCGHGSNVEVSQCTAQVAEKAEAEKCVACGHQSLHYIQGIEVGHTFLLGTRYSEVLKAQFLQQNGKPSFLQMGCFGLGLSRILGAVVECLCQESDIRWPLALAPFKVCIIPPKAGSKESQTVPGLTEELCHQLNKVPSLFDDIIVDDRLDLTIGRRLRDTAHVGYPFAVVVGRGTMESTPLFEVHNFSAAQQVSLPLSDVVQYLMGQIMANSEPDTLEVCSSVEMSANNG